MALTKISRSLLDTGISDSSDATAITIDSSENVGIGQGSPTQKLEVAGNIFVNTSGNPNLTVKTTGAGNNPNVRIQADSNYWDLQTLFSNTNNELDFRYNGTSTMMIDNSGRVGIGRTVMHAPLHIGAATPVFRMTDSDTDGSAQIVAIDGNLRFDADNENAQSSTNISFKIDNSERMRIDSSGNVGIGTSTITSGIGWTPKLVLNATSAAVVLKGVNSQENAIGVSNGFYLDSMGSTTGSYNNFYFRNSSTNSNFTASERMRIDADGNVMVGTTSTTLFNATSGGGALFFANGPNTFARSGTSDQASLIIQKTVNTGLMVSFRKDGTQVGTISTNANSLPSDRNFKRDISDLDLGLNLITKLKPSQYNYKFDDEDSPKMYGLIAQDLEESLTEVGVEKNSAWLLQHKPNNNEKESDYDLDYLKLTPVLIKAIQEQQEQIEALQSEINLLKGE